MAPPRVWVEAEFLRRNLDTRRAATGNAKTIRAATIACARQLAPEGTGLLLGPSHRMQSDIPPQSVDAMLEAFHAA